MTRVQLKREYMEQNKRYKILKICQISPQISTDKKKLTVETAEINLEILWNIRAGVSSEIVIFCRDITVLLVITSRK